MKTAQYFQRFQFSPQFPSRKNVILENPDKKQQVPEQELRSTHSPLYERGFAHNCLRGTIDLQSEYGYNTCISLQRQRQFSGKLWKTDSYSDFQMALLEISYFTYFIMHIPPYLGISLLETCIIINGISWFNCRDFFPLRVNEIVIDLRKYVICLGSCS